MLHEMLKCCFFSVVSLYQEQHNILLLVRAVRFSSSCFLNDNNKNPSGGHWLECKHVAVGETCTDTTTRAHTVMFTSMHVELKLVVSLKCRSLVEGSIIIWKDMPSHKLYQNRMYFCLDGYEITEFSQALKDMTKKTTESIW